MKVEVQNKKAVAVFFDSLNRGDIPALLDTYAEDGYCLTVGRTLIRASSPRIRSAPRLARSSMCSRRASVSP